MWDTLTRKWIAGIQRTMNELFVHPHEGTHSLQICLAYKFEENGSTLPPCIVSFLRVMCMCAPAVRCKYNQLQSCIIPHKMHCFCICQNIALVTGKIDQNMIGRDATVTAPATCMTVWSFAQVIQNRTHRPTGMTQAFLTALTPLIRSMAKITLSRPTGGVHQRWTRRVTRGERDHAEQDGTAFMCDQRLTHQAARLEHVVYSLKRGINTVKKNWKKQMQVSSSRAPNLPHAPQEAELLNRD